jgi:hypothetical protein
VPNIDFQSFVQTDADILHAIQDAEVSCIVFEDPQPFSQIEISQQLRTLVQSMPKVFPPIESLDVQVRFPQARPFCLRIFRVNQYELQQLLNQMSQPADVGALPSVPDNDIKRGSALIARPFARRSSRRKLSL